MTFEFEAQLWLYPGDAAWHFITLPREIAEEIRFFCPRRGAGWGSVRVEACIGASRWRTSVFPDKQSASFVLPVKAEIRKREKLAAGQTCRLSIFFEA
ncbi:DUF1905 domain-containing protein [Paramagnetospirillum magnetotacticum]|nr:DUF1905 domain-containing protein [Paramagnetospirillum magnetotacticum]